MKKEKVNYETRTVSVAAFSRELELETVFDGRGEIALNNISVSRPGLQLAGYMTHFDKSRVQVIGNAEYDFILGMQSEKRTEALEPIFKKGIPCMIVARGRQVLPEMLSLAEKYSCPVFTSDKVTTVLVNDLTIYQSELLAPTEVVHGELMEVYGVGILIMGKSGIGKSEIALELISRGHRLIADDSVIIKYINEQLIGKSPEKIRYYMEIRGIGIINVQRMFGPGAIRPSKTVEIVAELSPWVEGQTYDRIGTEENYTEILGQKILNVKIPVTPGRNIPVVLETAARLYRLRQAGYDPAKALMQDVFGVAEE